MSSFFHETINLHREGKTIDDIASILKKSRDEVIEDIVSYRLYNMKNFLDVVDDDIKMSIKADIINHYVLNIDNIGVIEYKQRTIDMIKLADQGLTYEQIAQLHNITRERVRQILNKYAPDLIILKKLNKQKECIKCGDTKLQVYNRGKKGMLCVDCYKKELRASKKRWSIKYEKCLDCGTIKVPHRGHGRCKNCHDKYLYRTDPRRRRSIKKSSKRWAKKNPEKLKIINERASKKAKEKIMQLIYGDAHIKKLEEQNYKCKVCNISQEEAIKRNNRKLYITHIDDRNDNSYANLVAVCSHCHAKRLRGEIKMKDYL